MVSALGCLNGDSKSVSVEVQSVALMFRVLRCQNFRVVPPSIPNTGLSDSWIRTAVHLLLQP